MPNTFRISVNLTHAVKRDSMDLSFDAGKLKRSRAFRWKGYFLQRHQYNAVLCPIVVTQLEFSLGEFRIPPDAAEEFVDWDHAISPLYGRCWIPIFGSRTQVLWHSGHCEGLVSLSCENLKPQSRQRADSTTALYSVCLRLRKRCCKSSATRLGDSSSSRAIWLTVIGLPSNISIRFLRNITHPYHCCPKNHSSISRSCFRRYLRSSRARTLK